MAQTINFDQMTPGALPAEWVCGVTGSGAGRWAVEADADAPSRPNVLKQSGVGDFPWCALRNVSIADGYVEVRFKALAGRKDQAGGVMWRWKDGNNYYIARANALENNVSLYYTENGRRITIKYVDAPVAANQWHTLRVTFKGAQQLAALQVPDAHCALTPPRNGSAPISCERHRMNRTVVALEGASRSARR